MAELDPKAIKVTDDIAIVSFDGPVLTDGDQSGLGKKIEGESVILVPFVPTKYVGKTQGQFLTGLRIPNEYSLAYGNEGELKSRSLSISPTFFWAVPFGSNYLGVLGLGSTFASSASITTDEAGASTVKSVPEFGGKPSFSLYKSNDAYEVNPESALFSVSFGFPSESFGRGFFPKFGQFDSERTWELSTQIVFGDDFGIDSVFSNTKTVGKYTSNFTEEGYYSAAPSEQALVDYTKNTSVFDFTGVVAVRSLDVKFNYNGTYTDISGSNESWFHGADYYTGWDHVLTFTFNGWKALFFRGNLADPTNALKADAAQAVAPFSIKTVYSVSNKVGNADTPKRRDENGDEVDYNPETDGAMSGVYYPSEENHDASLKISASLSRPIVDGVVARATLTGTEALGPDVPVRFLESKDGDSLAVSFSLRVTPTAVVSKINANDDRADAMINNQETSNAESALKYAYDLEDKKAYQYANNVAKPYMTSSKSDWAALQNEFEKNLKSEDSAFTIDHFFKVLQWCNANKKTIADFKDKAKEGGKTLSQAASALPEVE